MQPAGNNSRDGEQDPLLGTVLSGRFEVIAPIARGGMGKVYRAVQRPLGRVVALKVLDLRGGAPANSEFHHRFFLEAATAARLTHPNTIVIFDYGMTDEQVYYIAMEFIAGRTLAQTLKTEGAIAARRAVHIGAQIAGSIAEAHSQGIIHRDLKPSNVLLTQRGTDQDFVKVLDFGLVKVIDEDTEDFTQSGVMMGTPKYMSPEQINARDVTTYTDVYSLGASLYHAITGHPPFEGQTKFDILNQHVHKPPRPFNEVNPEHDAPASVEEIVLRCLEKDATRRPTMDVVVGLLRGCLQEIDQPRTDVSAHPAVDNAFVNAPTLAVELTEEKSSPATKSSELPLLPSGEVITEPSQFAIPPDGASTAQMEHPRRIPWGWISAGLVLALAVVLGFVIPEWLFVRRPHGQTPIIVPDQRPVLTDEDPTRPVLVPTTDHPIGQVARVPEPVAVPVPVVHPDASVAVAESPAVTPVDRGRPDRGHPRVPREHDPNQPMPGMPTPLPPTTGGARENPPPTETRVEPRSDPRPDPSREPRPDPRRDNRDPNVRPTGNRDPWAE